jgi:hypothetical protein
VIIAGVLIAHLVEVTLYAAACYASQTWLNLGRIDGHVEGGALDFFYFSITTYTTLGVGDLHPRGTLRLIAGVGIAQRPCPHRLVGVVHVSGDGPVLAGRACRGG